MRRTLPSGALALTLPLTAGPVFSGNVEDTLVSVHPIDREFAEGRATEVFLVMDDGREYRFAHPQLTNLRAGERLRPVLAPQPSGKGRVPVVCTLEQGQSDTLPRHSTRTSLCQRREP